MRNEKVATILEGIRCCLQPRRQCDQCPYGVEDVGVECRSLLFCEVKAVLGREKNEENIRTGDGVVLSNGC